MITSALTKGLVLPFGCRNITGSGELLGQQWDMGYWNMGYWNMGYWNMGYWNMGYWNMQDILGQQWDMGYWNMGYWNMQDILAAQGHHRTNHLMHVS